MSQPSVAYRRQQFDKFLYSIVREEEGAAPLTVLSVLARHNIDPWEAANQLTRVSWRVAAARLSTMISAQTGDAAGLQVPDPLAIQLLTRLPKTSMVQRLIADVAGESRTDTFIRWVTRFKVSCETKRPKE